MHHGNLAVLEDTGTGDIFTGKLISSVTRDPVIRKRPSTATLPIVGSSNAILSKLPPALFQMLRPALRRTFVRKEQYLVQQDDTSDYVYFPETAVVSEFHILDDGRMIEISLTGHEGAIGLSTLHRSARTANCVQVSQAGEMIRIESSVLRQVGRSHPELVQLILSHLENYIRQISLKSVCNIYHSIEERFCTWLLMLQDRCRNRTLKLTHEQMARILGVYRASVTYAAIDMRKKAMIDYSRGGITIRNRELLETGACSCYSEMQGL